MLEPLLSFVLVLALLVALWAVLRRLNEQAGAGRHLRVLESVPLGRGSQLTLVQVGERCFLLAAASERVSVLGEFEASRLPSTAPPAIPRPQILSCWPWIRRATANAFRASGSGAPR